LARTVPLCARNSPKVKAQHWLGDGVRLAIRVETQIKK
jgi:hypothetical protein